MGSNGVSLGPIEEEAFVADTDLEVPVDNVSDNENFSYIK